MRGIIHTQGLWHRRRVQVHWNFSFVTGGDDHLDFLRVAIIWKMEKLSLISRQIFHWKKVFPNSLYFWKEISSRLCRLFLTVVCMSSFAIPCGYCLWLRLQKETNSFPVFLKVEFNHMVSILEQYLTFRIANMCRLKNSGRQYRLLWMKSCQGEEGIEVGMSYEQRLKLYSMRIGRSITIWSVSWCYTFQLVISISQGLDVYLDLDVLLNVYIWLLR